MSRGVAVGAGVAALIIVIVAAFLFTGGDDEGTTSRPASSRERDAPSTDRGPQPGLEGLPPGFVECMSSQGYEIQSPGDIHSAPPDVLQACFGASH
jgi:hypothetical protein